MEQQGERVDDLAERLAENLDRHFEHLVVLYQDRLYRFGLRLTGNAQDAEEIAQDAFVRAYGALNSYSPERIRALALRAWLYRIALNVFRNRIRRRSLLLAPLDGELPDGDEREQPERAAEAAEQHRELTTRIGALPDRYRAAVVLRHVEELSIAEIAAVVGQPEGTVKSNIHRGIVMLRQTVDRERKEAVL